MGLAYYLLHISSIYHFQKTIPYQNSIYINLAKKQTHLGRKTRKNVKLFGIYQSKI